jgi:hypothetical protein
MQRQVQTESIRSRKDSPPRDINPRQSIVFKKRKKKKKLFGYRCCPYRQEISVRGRRRAAHDYSGGEDSRDGVRRVVVLVGRWTIFFS